MKSIVSLGAIAVAAAGTPQALSPGVMLSVQNLRITPAKVTGGAIVANTGFIYIGTATMNKATGAGVYMVLAPLQTNISGVEINFGDVMDLSNVYIDADTTGDGAIVGYLQTS